MDKKPKQPCWVAPEHARIAKDMNWDYPRDDLGMPIRGEGKRLVLDPRPTIMREEKRKYEQNIPKRTQGKVAKTSKNNRRKASYLFRDGRWSFFPSKEEEDKECMG